MFCVSLCLALQDELADGAGPAGDQQDNAREPDALQQEAAAAVRPDEADCKPSTGTCQCWLHTCRVSIQPLHLTLATVAACVCCQSAYAVW